MACDLMILNAEPRSYLMPVQAAGAGAAASRGRVAPRRLAPAVRRRGQRRRDGHVHLPGARPSARRRPPAEPVQELAAWHDAALELRARSRCHAAGHTRMGPGAGRGARGACDASSGASDSAWTPRAGRRGRLICWPTPTSAQVSEAGAGYSWAGNSRLHALTRSTMPVSDPAGEWFLLQDLRGRRVERRRWRRHCQRRFEHGPGWTSIAHRRGELEVLATWCVDDARWLKQVRIVLRQHGARALRLRVIGVCEWLLGERRADRQWVPHGLRDAAGLAETQRPHPRAAGHASRCARRLRRQHHLLRLGNFEVARCRNGRLDLRPARAVRRARSSYPADHFGQRAGAGLEPRAATSATLSLARSTPNVCSRSATAPRPQRRARWRAPRCRKTRGAGARALARAARRRHGAHARRSVRRAIMNRSGCCTRRWPAACGRAPGFYQAASAFVTSCRTRWRWPSARRCCGAAVAAVGVAPGR